MSIYHDEIEIEDFEFDDEEEMYYYPCPCGDRFEISKVSAPTVRFVAKFSVPPKIEISKKRAILKCNFRILIFRNEFIHVQEDLIAGEEVATCPSCSLIVRVIYDAVSAI